MYLFICIKLYNMIKIEVPAKTILTWMGERGIVAHDWATKLHQLQVCFTELRLNFPFDHEEEAVREIGQFIKRRESFFIQEQARSGLTFDYFEAVEIFRQLTETTKEGSQKFFFGGFKSQIVDDWKSLLKQYEEGLSMAEHARNLQHALNFAQPALKNDIIRLQSKVADGQQQQEILHSKIRELDRSIKAACEKLGVNSFFEDSDERLKIQIRASVSKLVPVFSAIVQLVQNIDSCANYYLIVSGQKSNEIDVNKELGTLRTIANYGDVTKSVFNAIKKGELRIKGEKTSILEFIKDASLAGQEIHKYDSYKQGDPKADDQWEIIQTEKFKTTDIGESEVDISPVFSTSEDTILSCSETRAFLLDDLSELECFLQQRLSELLMPDSQLRSVLESNDEAFILLRSECENQTKIKAQLKTIKEIKDKLEDTQTLQLIAIKKNPLIVDQLAQELIKQQKLKKRQETCLQELDTDLSFQKSELYAQKISLSLWENKIARLISQITQDLNKALKSADCHVKI